MLRTDNVAQDKYQLDVSDFLYNLSFRSSFSSVGRVTSPSPLSGVIQLSINSNYALKYGDSEYVWGRESTVDVSIEEPIEPHHS